MRTAIVGLGRMGRRHVQVVQSLGLDLVGVCDRYPEALSAAGAEHGIVPQRLHTRFEGLLADGRPELVVVATHAPSHAEFVCRAARAGCRYILCEKPMAVSLAECDSMLAECARHGARLAVNHQMRFMDQYREPKRIAASVEFGGLTSVTVVGGNIGMAMNGTHYFEMFRFLTGERPESVAAWFSPQKVANPRGAQFEDHGGAVRLVTAAGQRFYMEIGADQGHGIQVIYAGLYGQVVADELAGTMRVSLRQSDHRSLPSTRYAMPSIETTHQIAPTEAIMPTRAVLEALLRDGDYPTGEHGRQAIATLVAAYLSHEKGHVRVPLESAEQAADRTFPWA